MFVFDTDIISNLSKKSPSGKLVQRVSKLPQSFQYTTSINISELYYGAFKANHRRFSSWIENDIIPNIQILDFDVGSAKIYGKLKSTLEKRGRMKSEQDLRIASITIQYKFTLITGNDKHFKDIPGLKTENWI